jgi:hypothetical protein
MKSFFKIVLASLACLLFSTIACAEEVNSEILVLKEFKGCPTYSHKAEFSPSITDIYLAYGEDGKPVTGAAIRSFKSYEKITALLVVTLKDGCYVVSKAEVLDLEKIKARDKKAKVLDAIKMATGKVLKDTEGNRDYIVAVTGATPYQKSIYSSFDVMGYQIVAQMEENPEWNKKPVPVEQ